MSIDIFDEKFLTFYDQVQRLIQKQGCFRVAESGLYPLAPDTKEAHVWLDAIVARGRIVKLTPVGTWGQFEVYASPQRHAR